MSMRWVWHVLTGLTQLGNAILGGFPDESTSSRAYRQHHKPSWAIAEKIINGIFFWQPDHCRQAFESELNYRQVDPDVRDAIVKWRMGLPEVVEGGDMAKSKGGMIVGDVYFDSAGEWRWRMRRGGRIIADSSEGYVSRSNAERALSRMVDGLKRGAFQMKDDE